MGPITYSDSFLGLGQLHAYKNEYWFEETEDTLKKLSKRQNSLKPRFKKRRKIFSGHKREACGTIQNFFPISWVVEIDFPDVAGLYLEKVFWAVVVGFTASDPPSW